MSLSSEGSKGLMVRKRDGSVTPLTSSKLEKALPIFIGTHFFLWLVIGYMTPITIIMVCIVIYLITTWIIDSLGVEEQWDQFKKILLNPTLEKANVEKLLGITAISQSEAEAALSALYLSLFKWFKSGQRLRKQNIGKFTIRLVVLCLIVAYIGFWFLYFGVYALYIIPTILLFRVPARIKMFFDPYVKEAHKIVGDAENEDLEVDEESVSDESAGESHNSSSEEGGYFITGAVGKTPEPTVSGSTEAKGLIVRKAESSSSSSVDDDEDDDEEDDDDAENDSLPAVKVGGSSSFNVIGSATKVVPVTFETASKKKPSDPLKKDNNSDGKSEVGVVAGLTNKRKLDSDSTESDES